MGSVRTHHEFSLKDFLLGRIPFESKNEFLKIRRRNNLERTLSLSIYIIAIQIFLNVINIIKPSNTSTENVEKYIYLSISLLLLGIIYLILSILVKKDKIKNKGIRIVLPYSLVYIYVAIQLVFTYFNLDNNSWFSSYIIALLVLSFFVYRSPIHSTVSILLIFIISFIMMYVTRFANDSWDIAMRSDTWATMLIVTLLCNYMSVGMYHIYMKNVLNSIELKKINQKLSIAAKTDTLTEIYNRRGFYEQLDHSILSKKHKRRVIAASMIDIDYFKQYNDTYGHIEGDICLQNVANILKDCFRDVGGIVCRYGGEEFLAVFYADSSEEVYEIVENCRKKIAAHHIQLKGSDKSNSITISAGIAYASTDMDFSCDALISLADNGVYQAKMEGRNRTVMFQYNNNNVGEV